MKQRHEYERDIIENMYTIKRKAAVYCVMLGDVVMHQTVNKVSAERWISLQINGHYPD